MKYWLECDPFGPYLDLEQIRALLDVIPYAESVQGKRDKSFFLMCFVTAERNKTLRFLKWKHLRVVEERTEYCREQHDQHTWCDFPRVVWGNIYFYLLARKNFEDPQPDEYIFVFAGAPERPLNAREVNRLLKKYARKAGLYTEGLTVYTIRRSAMRLKSLYSPDAILNSFGYRAY